MYGKWLSGHMRGNGEPSSIPACQNIRIAAIPSLTVRAHITGAGVDNRDVPKNPHSIVLRREIPDRYQSRGLSKESLLIDEGPIRVRA
jgi:hypothetical protein